MLVLLVRYGFVISSSVEGIVIFTVGMVLFKSCKSRLHYDLLEKGEVQPQEKQKEIPTEKLQNLTPEELALLQKLLEKINNKTNASNELQQTKQNM
jgi:hypothetical protein